MANLFVRFPHLTGLAIDFLPPSVNRKNPRSFRKLQNSEQSEKKGESEKSENVVVSTETTRSLDPRFSFRRPDNCSKSIAANVNDAEEPIAANVNDTEEQVRVRLRFTRCQYARFLSLRFRIPAEFSHSEWPGCASDDKHRNQKNDENQIDENCMSERQRGAQLCLGLREAYNANASSDCLSFLWPDKRVELCDVTGGIGGDVSCVTGGVIPEDEVGIGLDDSNTGHCLEPKAFWNLLYFQNFTSGKFSNLVKRGCCMICTWDFGTVLRRAYWQYADGPLPKWAVDDAALEGSGISWLQLSPKDVDEMFCQRDKEEKAFYTARRIRKILSEENENGEILGGEIGNCGEKDKKPNEAAVFNKSLEMMLKKNSDLEGIEPENKQKIECLSRVNPEKMKSISTADKKKMDAVVQALAEGDGMDDQLFESLFTDAMMGRDDDDDSVDETDDLTEDGDDDDEEEEDDVMRELMEAMDSQLSLHGGCGRQENSGEAPKEGATKMDVMESLLASMNAESPFNPGPASMFLRNM
eukprot:CAMPEP_0113850220 /NCGR_PEP_ID=MMETSP0372-20130328/3705_1 /TAXON_ID=340204 /ORGANISM="Lankesteria abbotti" /LENGTH=525 /DNA_ID=CAMNT_0000820377 /DNA_START=59 /DNA_END=1636 /DNA_ORIENTATION=+ /assembly_acc=CAM_ASM_000359